MSTTLLVPLTYAALGVCVVALLVKVVKIAAMPLHLRWELAPVPREKGRSRYGGSYFETVEWWKQPREKSHLNELVYMLKEIVFLKGVWENNRALWLFSFPFHLGLYLLFALGGLLAAGAVASAAGIDAMRVVGPLSRLLAVGCYGLGALGAAGLLVSRAVDPRLRTYSTVATFFNLLLLLAVFLSGAYALSKSAHFAADAVGLAQSILTLERGVAVPRSLAAHLLSVLFFLAYLPFTSMTHFAAKYFTYHKIRWDDEPLVPGGLMEAEVQALLGQPVSWAAPHVGADGRKTWVDIATEESKS